MRLLKKGLSGDDVKKWQSFLFGQGWETVEVDGKFGDDTARATKGFQARHGLDQDGKVGSDTYAAALMLGMAIVENQTAYPPKPNFKSPDSEAREKMLGKFRYSRRADGTIDILEGWAAKNIVKVHIPQLAGVDNAPKDCNVYFHKAGVKQLQALFSAWERAGLIKYIKTWAGTFNPRMVRGSKTNVSNHAYASAFDINAAWNGLGVNPPAANKTGTVVPLVAIANAHGFYWGGHYNSRKDGMHFELAVLNMFPKAAPSVADTVKEIEKEENIRLEIKEDSAAVPAPILPQDSPSDSRDAQESDTPAAVDSGDSKPAINEPSPDNQQQIADQITNINSGDGKTVPDNFVPEDKQVNAPPAAGLKEKIASWWLWLGLAPPGAAGIFASIKDYAADGTINFGEVLQLILRIFTFVFPYIIYLLIAYVIYQIIKTALQQIVLAVQIYVNGRGDMNNVEIVPQKSEEPVKPKPFYRKILNL